MVGDFRSRVFAEDVTVVLFVQDRNKCLAQIDGIREQIRKIFEDCRKLGAEHLTLEDLDYEPDSGIPTTLTYQNMIALFSVVR